MTGCQSPSIKVGLFDDEMGAEPGLKGRSGSHHMGCQLKQRREGGRGAETRVPQFCSFILSRKNRGFCRYNPPSDNVMSLKRGTIDVLSE